MTAVLDKHIEVIDSINAIINTIVDEEALQTAAVAFELTKLCIIGTRLMQCLRDLDPGDKGTVRKLTHQFFQGTKDEETLADIMTNLDRGKVDLSIRMQLANVGLTRMVHDNVLANARVINRIDSLLSELFGRDQGLRLASLLDKVHIQGTWSSIVDLINI